LGIAENVFKVRGQRLGSQRDQMHLTAVLQALLVRRMFIYWSHGRTNFTTSSTYRIMVLYVQHTQGSPRSAVVVNAI